jgi:hypothetical protein
VTRLDWTRAQRRQRRQDYNLGAITDRRRRYLERQGARLKREAAERQRLRQAKT